MGEAGDAIVCPKCLKPGVPFSVVFAGSRMYFGFKHPYGRRCYVSPTEVLSTFKVLYGFLRSYCGDRGEHEILEEDREYVEVCLEFKRLLERARRRALERG